MFLSEAAKYFIMSVRNCGPMEAETLVVSFELVSTTYQLEFATRRLSPHSKLFCGK